MAARSCAWGSDPNWTTQRSLEPSSNASRAARCARGRRRLGTCLLVGRPSDEAVAPRRALCEPAEDRTK
eukprot:scaffold36934_cov61-Phaeocystis_antarctica.AAC.2